VAPLNTRLKAAELRPLLEPLQPALYIGHADLYRHIAAMDASIIPLKARYIVGGSPVNDPCVQPWRRLLENCAVDHAPLAPDVHSPAVLLATSGTTGQPKFAIHTKATLSAITASARQMGLDDRQIAMIALPLVHGYGLFTFLACLLVGIPVVLLERFDPDVALDAIERHRCSWMPAVPAMFAALVEHQQARPRNVRHLQTCLSSGDVCPLQLQEQFLAVFGTPLRSFWGATEAAGSLTYGCRPGPVSRIVKGAQVRLIDDCGVPGPLELLVSNGGR